MANVQDTLEEAIRSFPTLFTTGGDVLHHLFAVLGNGYKWVDGELVSVDGSYAEWTPEREQERVSNYLTGIPEVDEEMLKRMEQDIRFYSDVVKNASSLASNWNMSNREYVYPMTDGAAVLNIPENVKPDWVEAARYIRVQLFAAGWDISPAC